MMNSLKFTYSFLALTLLTVGSLCAQTSGTTTKPTATTSTNRQQELYDQYHGVTKKTAATTSTPAPAATPAQPQPRTSDYNSTQPTATVGRPQRISADGSSSGVRIGIRGGATYSIFTKKEEGVDPTVGFVGGLTFNFGAGTLSFQPEVNYARYSYKIDPGFGAVKAAYDALEVPLFLKIASGTYADSRFFVNVGPYGSYQLNISVDGKTSSLNGSEGRFSFGAAAGVGAALKVGPGHATIEVRGLYPLGNNSDGFSTDGNTILSQATIGYVFPLGGR